MTQEQVDARFQQGIDSYTQRAGTVTQPPMRPSNASIGPSSNFISDMDARVQQQVRNHVQQYYGVSRPRSMSVTVPLCNLTSPTPGWLTSIDIYQYTRIQGWMLSALGPGTITIDLLVSQIQRDQGAAPVMTSLISNAPYTPDQFNPTLVTTDADGNTVPFTPMTALQNEDGSSLPYIQLNGYSAFSFDTSVWFIRDITPPACLHVIVYDATAIQMASLGLYLVDLYSRMNPT